MEGIKESGYLKFVFIIVLLVAVLFSVSFVLENYINEHQDLGLDEQMKILSARYHTLTFPAVSATNELKLDQIPQELSFLLHPDAGKTTLTELVYENGRQGYWLAMNVPLSLGNTYTFYLQLLSATADWGMLKSGLSNRFGIGDAQNKKYGLRFTMKKEGEETLVDMNMIDLTEYKE